VELLLGTLVVDAIVDRIGNRPEVTGVIIENKSGRQAVLARVVVDASSDLDVVYRAIGEEGVILHPGKDRMEPGYYTHFGGVDNQVFVDYVLSSDTVDGYPSKSNPGKIRHHLETNRLLLFRGFSDIIDRANDEGLLEPYLEAHQQGLIRRPLGIGMKWVGHNLWCVGAGGLHPFDGTDAKALTEYDCLRTKLHYALLRITRLIPGWESAFVARTSQRIGLRETRVLRAVTMLTEDDIFDPAHDRPDVIGRSGAHDPGKNRLWKAYPIPYGCLVPEELNGVICAARAIGTADRVALNAHRGITPSIVVGQAAGTAAALAVESGVAIRDVDIGKLQNVLRKADVVLDVETVQLDTIPDSWRTKAKMHE